MNVRLIVTTLLLAGAGLLGGCWVALLNPLASKETIHFDRALLGEWVEALEEDADESADLLEISQGEEGGYDLVYRSAGDDEPDRFHADLVRLGPHRFLELRLDDAEWERVKGREPLVLTATMPLRLRLEGDTLRLAGASSAWLEERSKAGSLDLPHALLNGGVVLTAATEQLQAFFEKHADSEDLFADENEFRRRSAPP